MLTNTARSQTLCLPTQRRVRLCANQHSVESDIVLTNIARSQTLCLPTQRGVRLCANQHSAESDFVLTNKARSPTSRYITQHEVEIRSVLYSITQCGVEVAIPNISEVHVLLLKNSLVTPR